MDFIFSSYIKIIQFISSDFPYQICIAQMKKDSMIALHIKRLRNQKQKQS
jgi:hypothetical protein